MCDEEVSVPCALLPTTEDTKVPSLSVDHQLSVWCDISDSENSTMKSIVMIALVPMGSQWVLTSQGI